jgi:hypothetical protein
MSQTLDTITAAVPPVETTDLLYGWRPGSPVGARDIKMTVAELAAIISVVIAWGDITGTLSDQTDLQSALDAKAPLSPTVNAQTGTTYTLQASDAGKVVTLSNASAITVTCSGLADGNEVVFEQLGAGQVTFATGTLTVRHVASLTKTAGQYARVYARASGSNIIFCGDMSA